MSNATYLAKEKWYNMDGGMYWIIAIEKERVCSKRSLIFISYYYYHAM